MAETYAMEVRCENCTHRWNEEVPMGHPASGFWKCPYCGRRDGKVQGKSDKFNQLDTK